MPSSRKKEEGLPKPYMTAQERNVPSDKWMVYDDTSLDSQRATDRQRPAYRSISPRPNRISAGHQERPSRPPWALDYSARKGGYAPVPKAIPLKAIHMGVPVAFVAEEPKQVYHSTNFNAKNRLSEGWRGWSSDRVASRKENESPCRAQWHARNGLTNIGPWAKKSTTLKMSAKRRRWKERKKRNRCKRQQ
jgi:hypothetical protein